jgi:CHAT domain-containing protein/tetratricopeptide (TPR) repeat protein
MVFVACVAMGTSTNIVQGSELQVSAWEAGWARLETGDLAGARALFLERLQADPADLAAADGLITADAWECGLASSIAGMENIADLQAFLAGARFLEQREFSAASDEFVRASDLALARGDTLSAAVARRQAGVCRLVAAQPKETAVEAEALRALVAPSRKWMRLYLECELLSAGSLNMSAHLSSADSIYVLVVDQAKSANLRTILCDALNGRGTIGSKQRQPAVSIPWFQQALALAREFQDYPRTAKILKNLGYDHTQARQVPQALACYEEARDLAARCGLQDMLGHIHTGFGAAAEAEGDRQKAIEHFRNSYLAHASTGNRRGELGARQRLAYDLMVSGRFSEANTHYRRCLEIMDEEGSTYLLNWVLGGLALTHHKLGYLDQAEEYYRRAMVANEALGDRLSVAWCHLSLGWLEMLRGDYAQALVWSHESMRLYNELDDPEGVGDCHVVIAEVHFRLGDWEQARKDYLLGANLGLENGLEEILNRAYRGLAEVCGAANRPAEAKLYCERALDLAQSWSDNSGTIWALIQLAEQGLAAGDVDVARRRLADASSRLDPDGHFDFRSHARLLQARCADRPEEAVGLAAEALALAEEGCLPEREWSALADLGTYQLAAGDTAAARRSQLQAIEVVESLRRAVGTDELRRHMLRPALAPYERMIQLNLGDPDGETGPDRALEALTVSERSRAQVLTARLQAARPAGPGENTGGGDAEDRELLAGIAFLQARLQEDGMTSAERAGLREEVADLENNIRILRLENRSAAPASARFPNRQSEDLLGILGEGEQAVSYFLGEEESVLFHVRGDRVRAVRLPGRAVLESRVRRFLSLREGPEVPAPILEDAERGLFTLLLGPVANDLATRSTLVVIPDGILHRLPFATLRGSGGRLVDFHQVFVAPSLRTLASLRQRETARGESESAPDLSILAVGCGAENSSTDDADGGQVRRLHPFNGSPVAALAGAAEEARQVAALFDRSMVLTGSAADEASFKAAPLRRAQVLHIAAHSYADDREVRRSYVLLNSGARRDTTIAAAEDGLLQWGEAADLDLQTSLVTLASCRSAGGLLSVGEGVTGLTQAFLFAGATCVLAAQSDIADDYSRRFMLEFYEHLRRGVSAAEALRRVQLDFAGRPVTPGGRDYWADFVLVGDGSVTLAPAAHGGLSPRWKRWLIVPTSLVLILLIISIVRGRRVT